MKMKIKVFNGKDRPAIGKECPAKIKDLLPKMWDKNIGVRPSLDEVKSVLEEDIMVLSGGDDGFLDQTNRTKKSL